MINPSNPT